MGFRSPTMLRCASGNGILRVVLQREDQPNTLSSLLLQQLEQRLLQHRHAAPVLILEGNGTAFSAGHDLRNLQQMSGGEAFAHSIQCQRIARLIEAWPAVTIAHVQGYVLDVGLELALACDVLAGSGGLHVALPGLAWGLMPSCGALHRLGPRVGRVWTKRLFLGCETMNEIQAHAAGLISRRLGSHGELLELAREMQEYSPVAVAAIRDLRLRRQGRMPQRLLAELFSASFFSGMLQTQLRDLIITPFRQSHPTWTLLRYIAGPETV